jgi:hypothetical protein
MVDMVLSTALSPNSYKQCSSQISSRSKYGPPRIGFRKLRVRVWETDAEEAWKEECAGRTKSGEVLG